MIQYFRPLTASAIQFATGMARTCADDAVSSARAFESDAQSGERRAACICKTCFYIRHNRVGGAAITTWYCGVCGKEGIAVSTATNRVCKDCAREHSLCTWCGGDLESRAKRRKFPTPAIPSPPSPTREETE